jgi:hypothetical protein
MIRVLSSLSFLLVLGLVGCPQRTPSPKDTLKSYVAALEEGDYQRAYSLMARSFRKEYDRDEFVSHYKRNPDEVKHNVKELKKGPAKLTVKAEYRYGEGNRLRLVREEGTWRLALDPVTFYSQRTPRLALKSFVRALERRRVKILLRFVPRKWRKVMTVKDMKELFSKKQREATQQLIRNLKANLDNKIEVKGDEAEMLYGDSYKVQFVREDGVWKIVDAD